MKKTFLALFGTLAVLSVLAACDGTLGGNSEQTTSAANEQTSEAATGGTSLFSMDISVSSKFSVATQEDKNEMYQRSVEGFELESLTPDSLEELIAFKKMTLRLTGDTNEKRFYQPQYYKNYAYKTTNGLDFAYDKSDLLYAIYVTGDESIATNLGVRIGDSAEKVRELYGTPTRVTEDAYAPAWEYYNYRISIVFVIMDEKVYSWSISTEPLPYYLGND